jgi:hypothetical protein
VRTPYEGTVPHIRRAGGGGAVSAYMGAEPRPCERKQNRSVTNPNLNAYHSWDLWVNAGCVVHPYGAHTGRGRGEEWSGVGGRSGGRDKAVIGAPYDGTAPHIVCFGRTGGGGVGGVNVTYDGAVTHTGHFECKVRGGSQL